MYAIFTYIWLIFMVNVCKYLYHTWMLWGWILIPLIDIKVHLRTYGQLQFQNQHLTSSQKWRNLCNLDLIHKMPGKK